MESLVALSTDTLFWFPPPSDHDCWAQPTNGLSLPNAYKKPSAEPGCPMCAEMWCWGRTCQLVRSRTVLMGIGIELEFEFNFSHHCHSPWPWSLTVPPWIRRMPPHSEMRSRIHLARLCPMITWSHRRGVDSQNMPRPATDHAGTLALMIIKPAATKQLRVPECQASHSYPHDMAYIRETLGLRVDMSYRCGAALNPTNTTTVAWPSSAAGWPAPTSRVVCQRGRIQQLVLVRRTFQAWFLLLPQGPLTDGCGDPASASVFTFWIWKGGPGVGVESIQLQ